MHTIIVYFMLHIVFKKLTMNTGTYQNKKNTTAGDFNSNTDGMHMGKK